LFLGSSVITSESQVQIISNEVSNKKTIMTRKEHIEDEPGAESSTVMDKHPRLGTLACCLLPILIAIFEKSYFCP
jgi:hypothetical protein